MARINEKTGQYFDTDISDSRRLHNNDIDTSPESRRHDRRRSGVLQSYLPARPDVVLSTSPTPNSIRGSLSVDSCHTLVRALILSRLDYCNGLLYGLSAELIGKLDSVMRSAARLILKRQRFDHISTLMRNQLHWLDITARIKYKMCVFAFRCLKNTAPRYLSDYCIPVATLSGRSHLRSAILWQPVCACMSNSNNWTEGFRRGLSEVMEFSSSRSSCPWHHSVQNRLPRLLCSKTARLQCRNFSHSSECILISF